MSNTIYDFWLMVYQNYSKHLKMNTSNVDALPFQQKIAMLTDIIENDESKCAIYFPQNVGKFLCFLSNEERRQKNYHQSQAELDAYMAEHECEWFDLAQPNEIHTDIIVGNRGSSSPSSSVLSSPFNFNFFAIKTVDCLIKGGYTIRKFHCIYHTCKPLNSNSGDTATSAAAAAISTDSAADNESIERKVHLFVVYHYWFPYWPDHRSPENIDVVLDMCINVLDSDCEQELSNSHSNQKPTDSSYAKPLLLNHAPFNGPIPIIHWYVYFDFYFRTKRDRTLTNIFSLYQSIHMNIVRLVLVAPVVWLPF